MDLEKLHLKMVTNIKANFIMDSCMEKVHSLGAMVSNTKDSFLIIELQVMVFIDGPMEVYIKEMSRTA
jgi:hypothetical protein